ncbi:hypothetical protein TWF718_004835 [Orbilia javanica]|uniref:Nephrocystin 3-like N-terminal domain-containing protein n=1 Tax=Orbilia javanica TaxID=47235 RepID=A0AAN8RFA9_9PEZI
MDPLSTAASIIAVTQAIGSCWKIYSSIKDAQDDIEEIRKEVISVEKLVKRVREELVTGPNGLKFSTSKELENALEGCLSELERLKDKLGPEKGSKRSRFFGVSAKWPLKGPDAFKIVGNLERWKQSIDLALTIDQVVQLRNVNRKLDFAGLPFADGAAYGSFEDQHQPECLPNTRVQLLKDIGEWVEDPRGKCVFWLSGVAGTGKSTISRTIARALREKDQLAASFFFKRGEKDRGDASKFFTTLTSQLANYITDLAPGVQNAINDYPRIASTGHREQFDKLIFQPLSQLICPPPQTVKGILVIDALDECDRELDQRLIVSLLAQLREIRSIDIRVFLTSRPELPLRLGFKELSGDIYREMILHEIPEVEDDIAIFLRAEFAEIRISHSLPSDWPGDRDIQKLAKMAVPLFIFAATACRFIADSDPEDQIKIVMSYHDRSDWHVSQLERTYLPILHQLVKSAVSHETLVREFKEIVGTIVNLASPLSIPSLSQILCISERAINNRLKSLHSVLDMPTPANPHAPIRIFHLSFRDFLSDQRLRGNREFHHFWIDHTGVHRSLYKKCIELMSNPKGLRKDICNLKSPGILRSDIDKNIINRHLPPGLQYACRYWAYHLKQSNDNIRDNDQVHEFLKQHILHWLEAIALLGEISIVTPMMEILSSIIDIHNSSNLAALFHDIKRFLRQSQRIVDMAPLQTYWSALVFAPTKSIVRSIFNLEEIIPEISQLPRVQVQWDALLNTLDGHTDKVDGVTFSTDVKRLASTSFDGTVRVWDAASGAPLLVLKGHTSYVSAVAFSADNTMLVSASCDCTIRIWDPTTGALLQTLEGHTEGVWDVSLSADNKTLASAARDCTIRIWDVPTGVSVRVLEGHTDLVSAVAFFFDDKLLASASHDSTVKVWDAATGALVRVLEGHKNRVGSIAFSVDSKTLASASIDHTIRIWDATTGSLLRTLEDTLPVWCVAFSVDNKTLASGSNDRAIRIWDAATGALVRVLEGHAQGVNSLAFSLDGKLLASASDDYTARVWDADAPQLALEGHTREVLCVAFSIEGKMLASTSYDHTIRIWDAATGALVRVLDPEEQEDHANGVAFSADSKTIASGSWFGKVKIWDVATGTLLQALENNGEVNCVAFSADSKTIAAGSKYNIIRIWDVITGTLLRVLEHSGEVTSVVFSADNKTIVSASWDSTVKIWDAATGDLLRTLEHESWVSGVAFSADDKILASVSTSYTVRAWEAATGAPLQRFQMRDTRGGWVKSIYFSKDGRHIITERESFPLKTNEPPPSSSGINPHQSQYKPVTVEGEWLARGGERLLWLPYNYRPQCTALYDNTICLGLKTGDVVFFTFKN